MEPTTNLSMLTMIQQGWLATYPLIFMSIVSLTVIAERSVELARAWSAAPRR